MRAARSFHVPDVSTGKTVVAVIAFFLAWFAVDAMYGPFGRAAMLFVATFAVMTFLHRDHLRLWEYRALHLSLAAAAFVAFSLIGNDYLAGISGREAGGIMTGVGTIWALTMLGAVKFMGDRTDDDPSHSSRETTVEDEPN